MFLFSPQVGMTNPLWSTDPQNIQPNGMDHELDRFKK